MYLEYFDKKNRPPSILDTMLKEIGGFFGKVDNHIDTRGGTRPGGMSDAEKIRWEQEEVATLGFAHGGWFNDKRDPFGVAHAEATLPKHIDGIGDMLTDFGDQIGDFGDNVFHE